MHRKKKTEKDREEKTISKENVWSTEEQKNGEGKGEKMGKIIAVETFGIRRL